MRNVFVFFVSVLLMGSTVRSETTNVTALVPEAPVDLKGFARLSVLSGGRVMPMDSLARIRLLQLSGKRTYERKSALEWMSRVMWSEDEAVHNEKVFLVNNPELAQSIGMTADSHRRYSFNDLNDGTNMVRLIQLVSAAREVESDDRDVIEKESLVLYNNAMTYLQLTGVFSYADPHRDMVVTPETAKSLGVDSQILSPLDVATRMETLRDVFLKSHATGADPTPFEREIFGLIQVLQQLNERIQGWAMPFEVLVRDPDPRAKEAESQWMSPWEATVELRVPPSTHRQLEALALMRTAYREADSTAFNEQLGQFVSSRSDAVGPVAETRYAGLELMLNGVNPFLWCKILYTAAFIVTMLMLVIRRRRTTYRSILEVGTLGLLFVGFGLHTLGILSRMLVMGRPPITNLYTTFVFVAWICVLVGLLMVRIGQSEDGRVLASLSGAALLFLSSKFGSDGDTMGVMVAVLNSNFWLATHVVAINIGYAGCCASGVLGGIYMINECLRGDTAADKAGARMRYGSIVGVLGFGLIFSALGTILGGVWADESWGRFWGWDPKENGALLIVLWCALMFHLRIGGFIRQRGMAIGAWFGISVVMLAWFGVNLLNTGLHNYGFISGVATGLLAFILFQFAFVFIVSRCMTLKERARKAASGS